MNVSKALHVTGLIAASLVLAACGSSETSTSDGVSSAAQGSANTTETAGSSTAVVAEDMWVKAADEGMSAAFGILRNETDKDVRVTAATSDASPIMELHETVEEGSGEMIMREKKNGFVIPAGGEFPLAPGANHLMLMSMEKPVKAGDTVRFALTLADGSTIEFSAPGKDYSGANERYVPGE